MVVDTLSHQKTLASLTVTSTTTGDIVDAIRSTYSTDPSVKQLLQQIETRETRCFWVEDGVIYIDSQRPYVPAGGLLRRQLLREVHNAPHAKHLRQQWMLALLTSNYYWSGTKQDVEMYMRTCLTCQ